jgi:hypothetical protein
MKRSVLEIDAVAAEPIMQRSARNPAASGLMKHAGEGYSAVPMDCPHVP